METVNFIIDIFFKCNIHIRGQQLKWGSVNIFIKTLHLVKGMQVLVTGSNALIFLLILLHMEFRWFSKLSSESMMIPTKVSAVLEGIIFPLIHNTWWVLELSNKWHFPGWVLIRLLSNQLKTFAEVTCNSELTVGMPVAVEQGVVSSAWLLISLPSY